MVVIQNKAIHRADYGCNPKQGYTQGRLWL